VLVDLSLTQARVRLQELLTDLVAQPEMADLAKELEQTFSVLRNYSYFADYQHRELAQLCQEMERL